jgi:subtilisin family serine protease
MGRSARPIGLGALLLMLGAAPLQARASAFNPPHHRVEVGGHIVNGLLTAQIRALISAKHLGRRQKAPVALPVIVESTADPTAAIRVLGGKVSTNLGGKLVTASMPVTQIGSLARHPGIQEIYPDQVLQPLLDRSVPEIRATSAWGLSDSSGMHLRGNGVLVGIVDSGIDYRNPDFIRPDGSTRIKYIWDQTQSGRAPLGYDFGFECDAASINSGGCPEQDTDGHGTNVAGIAAGNGRSSVPAREIGVAPEADIIAVKSEMTTSKIIAAWEYLIARAHELREPIVINNSFGSVLSPHDGSSPLALAADRLSAPGVIFVAAAGNEGNQGLHTDGALAQGDYVSVPFTVDGASRLQFGFFYPAQDVVQVGLTNRDTGESTGSLDLGNHIDTQLKSGETVSLMSDTWNSQYHFVSGEIEAPNGGPLTGHYGLLVKATQVVNTARFDAWLSSDATAAFGRPDESDTIAEPADSHHVIAVANYATRTSWVDRDNQSHSVCDGFPCTHGTLAVGDIASYSSVGPTADGRQKPDIAAPGTMIISSLSRDASICSSVSEDNCLSPKLITSDGKNMIATGTSMSSPHVAGVVALMLQANPQLTYDSVSTILKATARHDQFTGNAPWTPIFGAGKVDAYAATESVLRQGQPPSAQPTPPTSQATQSPPTVPTTFNVISIHTQRSNASVVNGTTLSQSRVGRTVWLSIYYRVASAPANSQATATFSVRRGKTLVDTQNIELSLSGALPETLQALDLYKLEGSGMYTISGRIAINGTSHTATVRLSVKT